MDLNSLGQIATYNKEQASNILGDRLIAGSKEIAQQSPEEIRKAANEFESFFLSYLLKVMRQTVPTGLIDNKMGHLFDSFYDQEIGLRGAQAGGIGLSELMVRAYTQNQGDGTKNNLTTLSSSQESLPKQGSRG
jgi:flagellar protein FlgJ